MKTDAEIGVTDVVTTPKELLELPEAGRGKRGFTPGGTRYLDVGLTSSELQENKFLL
jgi:hypothetical protein